MAKLVREKDWSKTPLGPIESWPQSLRTTVSLCLASNFPISLAWGTGHVQIYNDGYWPVCGAKHPLSMGQDFTKCWASAWPAIGEAFERALTGRASYLENIRMFLDRNGYLEETFFTFSFSPIRDESGNITGLFHPVTEQTGRILAERRTRALRDLAAQSGKAKLVDEVFAATAQTLSGYAFDVPFLLVYQLGENDRSAQLVKWLGVAPGTAASPRQLDLENDADNAWPLKTIIDASSITQIEHCGQLFREIACGPYPEPPQLAIGFPIAVSGLATPTAVVIAGVSARLPFDQVYRDFYVMIAATATAGVASARAYEEERKRAETLAELDRAKTAFFSNVSHEFRTPLALMLGPVEDVLNNTGEVLSARQRSQLEVAHRNALRLLKLVNTLLDFSRIEAGRAQGSFEPTDLGRLTTDLASNFQSACDKAGLALRIDCPASPEEFHVDPEMWEKIILNLLSNAFKYTLEGEINVSLRYSGSSATLHVNDSGIGIDAAELPKIFERFHRIEGQGGRTQEGTGIGLALVKELVKIHGGTIQVESERGAGSRFSVTLPSGSAHLPQDRIRGTREMSSTAISATAYLAEALRWLPDNTPERPNAVSDIPMESMAPTNIERRPRVVLADDNADMRAYIKRILEQGGYDVQAVGDGVAAVAAATTRPMPDLVLTDVMMPRLDGFGVLKALRADLSTCSILVILLSARAGGEARVEGLTAGADDYIVKPFGARELLARVDSAIRLAQERQAALSRENELRAELVVERGRAVLRETQTKLEFALESARLGSWELDVETGEASCSARHDQIFGYAQPPSRWSLTVFSEHLLPEDRDRVAQAFRQAVETASEWHFECRIRRADNQEIRWIKVNASPQFGPDRQVARYIGLIQDITEQKEADEALRKTNAELEQFAFVASHDLQEPLRKVGIFSQLLIERSGNSASDDARLYAEHVRTGVQRMQHLIRDLLVYSRTIHSNSPETPQVADLNQSLAQALGVFEEQIKATAAVITAGHLPEVRGEETQLSLVFQNLISNALRYRTDVIPPKIDIQVHSQNDEWIVSVRDNGIGFAPEYAEKIFGLFKRLNHEGYPGTGLGLAICKRIVERYGGRIWATSGGEAPRDGATFWFALPRA